MNLAYSIVLGAWVAQLFAMGLSIGVYPVFIASIEAEFAASRAQTSLGIPLVMLVGAVLAPRLGQWVDQGSPQRIMALGAVIMSLGLWCLSQQQSLALLTLCWVVLVGVGQASLGVVPAQTVLANWFESQRALMVAIAGTGITVGAAIFPPIAEFLISNYGWRNALVILSICCLLIATPLVLLCIRKAVEIRPADRNDTLATEETTVGTAVQFFSDRCYWLAGLSLACMPGTLMAFNTHVVSWAEELQYGREFGVGVLSSAAIATAFSSLMFGRLCERLGAINSLRLGLFIEISGWVMVLTSTSDTSFFIGAMLFAAGAGSFLPAQASLISTLWPVRVFGQATGTVGLLVISGVFVLPTLIGFGFEHYQTYEYPMRWLIAVLLTPIALLTLLHTEISRRENDQGSSSDQRD